MDVTGKVVGSTVQGARRLDQGQRARQRLRPRRDRFRLTIREVRVLCGILNEVDMESEEERQLYLKVGRFLKKSGPGHVEG